MTDVANPVLVLHTTESRSFEGTVAWFTHNPNIASHRVIDPLTGKWRQFIPWDKPAKSLRNLPGGSETNRRGNVYQVEIVGRAADMPHMPDSWYQALAAMLAPICAELGIPIVYPCQFVPYPQSYGRDAIQRLDQNGWPVVTGIIGHEHVDENDHGDPGDISRLKVFLQPTPPPEVPQVPAQNPTVTEIERWVERSYAAAGNTDQRGQRAWVRESSLHANPLSVLAEMDRQLGL